MMLPRLLLLVPFAVPQAPPPTVDQHRVLMVFAPTDTDPRFQRQIGLLAHHGAELKERDLILRPNVVHAATSTPDTLRTLNSPDPAGEQELEQRTHFHVAPSEFTVILVGKDGGEKLRQHTPLTFEQLAAKIDAMLMRREEMRKQK